MNIKHGFPFLLSFFIFAVPQKTQGQVHLEFAHDSIMIDTALPENTFQPKDEPIIFSNVESGGFRNYSEKLKSTGIQFQNGQTNYMYNTVLLSPEPDSLCREQSCYDRSWFSSPVFGVHGEGTKLLFLGDLFKGDNTYAKTSIALFDHGHFVFGKDVVVDLVYPRYGNYTRQLWVFGDGTGVFELEEGFIADRSEMGTKNVSFGSVRLSNVNFITHNSEAIPHYYMKDDGDSELVLRNAHLVFENEPGTKWIVASNPQQYEGGIQVYTDCIIQTNKDLLLNGFVNHWPNKKYYDYGGIILYHDSLTLTKSGEGTLTFDCDMAFNPQAMLRIEEGGVVFKRDALNQQVSFPQKVKVGNHLSIQVESGAELSILADTMHIDRIVINEGAIFSVKSSCLVYNYARIDGDIVIDISQKEKGIYRLFSQPLMVPEDAIQIIGKGEDQNIDLSGLFIDGSFTIY